jgi:endonuclease I
MKRLSRLNIEHVVPQSFIKEKNLKKDMHNLLWVPMWMNSHRARYRYADIDIGGKVIETAKKCNKRGLFEPPEEYKGFIARCGLYFAFTYPKYEDLVFNKVISEETASKWHFSFPPTEKEKRRNFEIQKIQGNINFFIVQPKKPLYFVGFPRL